MSEYSKKRNVEKVVGDTGGQHTNTATLITQSEQ